MGTRQATPQPAFAWSETRHRRFSTCQRKHFLAVYQAHGGWLPNADPERRLAWMMGKLIPNWSAALGSAVHRCATRCIVRCATGRPLPSYASLHRRVVGELNALYCASRDHLRDFWHAPAQWPMLASHFYGDAGRPTEIEQTRHRLDAAVQALLGAEELWALVSAAGPHNIWIPPRFFSFSHSSLGLQIFAAPDVVVRPTRAEPTEIWDFKVGSADGVIDQVLVYALALREATPFSPFTDAATRYRGRVVHLHPAATSDSRVPFTISDADLASAEDRIRVSAAAMQSGLRDVAQNIPGDVTTFLETPHCLRCTTCQFRGLCKPEQFTVARPPQAGSLA